MQDSNSVEQLHDERQTHKRRSRRFIIALLLTLLLLSLPLLYFSPIGQAWQQSRDMEELSGEEFDIKGFAEPSDWDEFWLKFLPREGVLDPLTAIGLVDEGKLPELLDVAGRYSSWEYLDLTVSHGSEVALRFRLQQWVNLDTIRLDGDFGNEAVPSLAHHRALRHLALDSPGIDSDVIDAILPAQSLQHLTIKNSALSDERLVEVLQLPTLAFLSLIGNRQVTSTPFEHAVSETILLLEVDDTAFDDDGFQAVLHWPALEQLRAERTLITDQAFSDVGPDHQLTYLSIRGTGASSAALPAIARFTKLHTLNLTETDIGDDNLESLNELDSLSTLYIEGTNVTAAGLKKLQLAKLEIVTFPGEGVTVEDVWDLIRRNPELWDVTISDSTLTEEDQRRLDASYPNINFSFYRDND